MSDETTVSETTTTSTGSANCIQTMSYSFDAKVFHIDGLPIDQYIESIVNRVLDERNTIPAALLDLLTERSNSTSEITETNPVTNAEPMDRAEALLRRIRGIETRFPYFYSKQIAWAILYTDSGLSQYQEPFPE